MKTFRAFREALLLAATILLSGCVSGHVLTLPGELSRPEPREPLRRTMDAPAVAVLDFSFAGTPPYEIGRDFDHARTIVSEESPGTAVPNLIADVLDEMGVRAVRVSGESLAPPDVVAKVWGSIDRFRVEARKTGSLRMKVEYAASVSVTVHAAGGSAAPGWNSAVASEYWTADPLFVTPGGVREAVNGAVNAVAEEVARRLIAAGVVTPPGSPAGIPGR